MNTFTFSFKVETDGNVPEDVALWWLRDTLRGSDLELPDGVFYVQTIPAITREVN